MNIYATVAEDIDFITPPGVVTTSGYFRSGWARCAVGVNGNPVSGLRSLPFNAGAQTNAWLTARFIAPSPTFVESKSLIGFGLSGTNNFIGIGCDSSGTKFTLVGSNGSSYTTLATEAGTDFLGNALLRIDMQLSNFGSSGTLSLYVNSALIVTYTGNLTQTGFTTGFDSVFIGPAVSSIFEIYCSEIVVADSDTRGLLGLQTMALTGAGTTTSWSNNTFSNINAISYSDASPAYTNTTAQDQEYTVTAATPSVFSVIAVTQSARAAIPSGSTPTHLKLGYGSSGTGYFGSGSTKSPTTGFASYTQIDQTNPITSATWTQSNLSSLQLDMQSD